MKTYEEARRCADDMEALHKDKWHVFITPINSQAYQLGIRFGTCRDSEYQAYKDNGAKFVDPIDPTKRQTLPAIKET